MCSNGIFVSLLTLSLLLGKSCSETDTLHQGQFLKDGQELVSAFKIFKLKFFNFKNSENLYLGIWFNNLYLNTDSQDRPVWIANRNNPISDRSGSLTVDSLGRLKILRGASTMLELSSIETTRNTTLQLLDSGNLQLQEMDADGSMKRVLWQSFDYPTDTLLPGMKLGFDGKTRKRWELTSWLGDTLPASGSFVFGMDTNITNVLTILWRGNMYWSSGLWNKGRFSEEELNECGFLFSFVSTKSGQYFMYSGDQDDARTFFPTIMIDEQGILRREQMHRQRNRQNYRNRNCLAAGYVVRDEPYGFTSFRVTVSSSASNGFVLSGTFSSVDCSAICLQNSSCLAYASTEPDGTGCEIWNTYPTNKGSASHSPRTIYIRGNDQEMLLRELGIDRSCIHKRNERKSNNELQIFSFESVVSATDDFSDENKLGEGGFGPVYKGKLLNGEEVAIKRLSLASGQGLVEFKNEAILIAKLQHTNLVQVLGCCIEKDEKMLIYEYMQNKSLDYFLFDPLRKNVLDWTLRFRIMEGIIQGLLYLHKYSRLKVIHRDIKASNILLDEDMNPKISDFGLARIFGAEETRANTKRVAGTL
ncbi:lectin protein kinase family protein [Arabidopsis thaliana]|uniref:lectin protein kinase family protein n=1 Tax=Arabidopsis thaliana TaxID=3702 RepID=UPI000034F50A|nr:lectin protein kinase family protein [Arabidopsis thaliana]AEE34658.1 lectin protein kinase family protein [Arabidopsis thaliana]|eukprot:NP_176919.2 lectin protein kinase family protein [Arabidopsis thaliana]